MMLFMVVGANWSTHRRVSDDPGSGALVLLELLELLLELLELVELLLLLELLLELLADREDDDENDDEEALLSARSCPWLSELGPRSVRLRFFTALLLILLWLLEKCLPLFSLSLLPATPMLLL